jgi:predicted metalloprotease
MRQVAVVLAMGAALAIGCGSDDDAAPRADGRALFAQRCSGCHTLSDAGARGTVGVDLDRRRVSRADALFAIRHGGFGSTLMPANIVTGEDAEAVAGYVAEVSGREAPARPIESAAAHRMKAAVPAGAASAPDPGTPAATHADAPFLRAAFDSAQEAWRRQFAAAGATFRPGHLVLFHTAVHTPCGVQTAQTGPFYCPAAQTVYLNTDFFDALAKAYNLRSGFAAAYVTAHEVGHHVQFLLGVLQRRAQVDAADPDGANARSVLTELQADCYAGVWLHELDGAGALSDSDMEDIVRAAAVVGDDFQRKAAGRPLAPETWTHGSSEQRVRWLKAGVRSGAPAACDTFGSASAPS